MLIRHNNRFLFLCIFIFFPWYWHYIYLWYICCLFQEFSCFRIPIFSSYFPRILFYFYVYAFSFHPFHFILLLLQLNSIQNNFHRNTNFMIYSFLLCCYKDITWYRNFLLFSTDFSFAFFFFFFLLGLRKSGKSLQGNENYN